MMRRVIARRSVRNVTGLAFAACLVLSGACATLAHRSSSSAQLTQHTTSCTGHPGLCPWLIGDGLLLIPGIVPGVIAFVVDFSTGAWNHDNCGQNAPTTMTASSH